MFEGDSVIEVHEMNLKNKKNSSVGHLAREVEALISHSKKLN